MEVRTETVKQIRHSFRFLESMKEKRKWLDYVIAVPATVVCAPLLAGIALWVKVDSPGPVFFRQKRVGIHQTHFDILKFRTMRSDTPKDVPTHLLKNPEQYITKSGKFLRATSLDELPQLFNILKGEMSLVGPRPALWNQYDLLEEREKYGANDVLPGLTGWAQIHGRDTISIQEKAKLDGYYVKHQGIGMDIRCLAMTVAAVLKRDGIREGAAAEEENKEKQECPEEKPLVSVVMATYHRTTELVQALESLGKQTWKAMEIILVDDNADPEWNKRVEEVVKNFRKKYQISLKYLVNSVNSGSAASRNRGIAEARGEYVTFLDDDDKYRKEKMERQVRHMQKLHSDVSLMDLALYREDGRLEEIRRRTYLKPEEIQEEEHLLAKHFMYHMTGTDTFMFRRTFLQRLGGFPPKDIGDEFYLMEKAIEHHGKISYLARCDVKALVHRETFGLSSRESKIQGENQLFAHKKKHWIQMNRKERRQICMRHHMVLGYAYLRNRQYPAFVKEGIQAFFYAPWNCVEMVVKRK